MFEHSGHMLKLSVNIIENIPEIFKPKKNIKIIFITISFVKKIRAKNTIERNIENNKSFFSFRKLIK